MSVESNVKERYANGATVREEALCCPVDYDPIYLQVIPDEIIERDYGCGDPSKYLKTGETVLDLGSGAGKICFIAAQVVGKEGHVIGVDMTDEMLQLAEKHKKTIAKKIGYSNVSFKKGYIQNLKLDIDKLNKFIEKNPAKSLEEFRKIEDYKAELMKTEPLIADNSIDVIVSNCVLNLVSSAEKKELFNEMFRVLKKGGRCVISDIVSDETTPDHLQKNPELWSGCISGAFQEYEFLKAFEDAGFHGIEVLNYDSQPWQTIEGIEYKSMTVVAYKGKQGQCLETNKAVIYKGPWKAVVDDDGHTLYRGERMAVCEKTFQIYTSETYQNQIIPIEPIETIHVDDANQFDCRKNARRNPRETKGLEYNKTELAESASCDPSTGCC